MDGEQVEVVVEMWNNLEGIREDNIIREDIIIKEISHMEGLGMDKITRLVHIIAGRNKEDLQVSMILEKILEISKLGIEENQEKI